MGKKKQAQRTKNNAVPASSGRSAELLQSTSGVPFVGFNALKQGGYIPILTGLSDDLDVTINEDFRLVWKKMNKKDITTKLKALDEFKRLCQECNVELLKPVLPFWPRVYCILSTDEEHRVREAAHSAHRALVIKAGRNIAPYLKQLVGPWFTGQHDTHAPAASAAQAAFQETFPANKMTEAIVFCQDEILSYICDNLLNQTPQTLSADQNSSKEAKDARYERVIVSCLNGYALYLTRLPIEHLHKAEDANRKLITSAKFWKFNKDPAPIVRAAWFTALVALCEKGAFLLSDEAKHVCMAVFTNLDESDPAVVRSLWQTVLLTFTVVDDVWKYVSLEKLVLPKLWKMLREGAVGSASLVYPNLLPLLSKIPTDLLKDKSLFYSKFFDNLQEGLKVRSVQMSSSESSTVVTTHLECIRYLVSVNSEDQQLCLSLVENKLFPLVEAVLSDPKCHLARSSLFWCLAGQVNSWSTAPFTYLAETFWRWLDSMSQSLLEAQLTDSTILVSRCTALQILFNSLAKPQLHRKKSLKVKFVSPRKPSEEEEEDKVCGGWVGVCERYTEAMRQCVDSHLHWCFMAMKGCGQQAVTALVSHLAIMLDHFHSAQTLTQLVKANGGNWEMFYQSWLGKWLREDNVPLHLCLELIFTFLQCVEADCDINLVFTDLSQIKWQKVLEWGLKAQQYSAAVEKWLQSHGAVCQLVATLTREHTSYNTIHNCLRNLRHNSWLTRDMLQKLLRVLCTNLSDSSVVDGVKMCSEDLLEAMLHNTANHPILTHLPATDLQSLLYQLFSLPRFSDSWQHCVSMLTLHPGVDLAAVCYTCVDLLVVDTTTRSLEESRQQVSKMEQLLMAVSVGDQTRQSQVLWEVVNHLVSRTLKHSPTIWTLLNTAQLLCGSLRDPSLPCDELISNESDDPLSCVPLQQCVALMVPVLEIVLRLQTGVWQGLLPYDQLKSALPQDDLWQWTVQVLHFQAVLFSIQQYFSNTKQYLILKDKIDYFLQESNLLYQLEDVKDIIKHLRLSVSEELSPPVRLQVQLVLRNLDQLYSVQEIQDAVEPHHHKNPLIKNNYFPAVVLDEMAAVSEPLDRSQLVTINTCCQRLATQNPVSHIPISIIDKVFDQFVAEEKTSRSLVDLSAEELHHIAEVADFTCHSVSWSSAHLCQSSWDACLVATSALALSVSTSLTSTPADSLTLPMVRVVCSECRLFDALSAHMASVDPKDKAAVTRATEWTEVFLAETHAALYRAWLAVADLSCDRPSRLLLIEALCSSVTRHVQYPHCIINNTLDSLDTCCRLLQSPQPSIQLTAYHLFLRLIPAMLELDTKQSEKDNVALSCQHVEQSLAHTQSIVETILSEFSFGDLCTVEPFTDSYRFTRCYLLLWSALLDLCGHATSQLRALYTTWLRMEYLPVMLKVVFCLMPEAALHGEVASQRIAHLFSKPLHLDKGVWGSTRLAHLSCWVYGQSLRRLPAAIRQWWNEADHRVYTLVENVTSTYVSPDLGAEELRSLQSHDKKFDNITVQVYPSNKEVFAVYTFEDCQMDLAIEMAHNHPLGLLKVRSGQRMASTAQTRQWLLQVTILLTHQNGSIWDALELWKHSLDKRFEGVEECYICFAVLHSVNHQMPKLTCQTCRKKFHSNCLYKWFTTSHKSTCPICRNLF